MTEADVRARVGAGLSNLMKDVLGTARAAEGASIFRAAYDRVCEEQTHAVAGLIDVLAALSARSIRMSVASNKPAVYSSRILARLGAAEFMDTVEGPETAGVLKPDPAMIHACLAAMGVSPPDAVYVGDMTIDAVAARNAGVAAILIRGGSSSDAELEATGFPVVGALADLLALM
jgi:HAD superfamily hydrolase (TIGR01549 family)